MKPAPLIVGVLSCHKYEDRRASVADTWMQDFKEAGIFVTFIIGNPTLPHQQPNYDAANDVLWVPCPDDMANLSLKVKHFARWSLEHFAWRNLFKCDDDTFVAVERLLKLDLEGRHYVGKHPGTSAAMPYASGGAGYFLSRTAAEIVATGLDDVRGEWHEDLTIGRLLLQHGIKLHEERRLNAWQHNFPAPGNDYVTSHHISPEKMCELHEAFYPERYTTDQGDGE